MIDNTELIVGDKDGGLCVYNIPDDSIDLSNPLPPKLVIFFFFPPFLSILKFQFQFVNFLIVKI